MKQIDKYTAITPQLVISGQPTSRQFAALKDHGIQLVLNLQIAEMAPTIKDEHQQVTEVGLLYEEIPISLHQPQLASYTAFANILQQHAPLTILVHCIAGYCSSGLMIPYLVQHHNMTIERAQERVIFNDFSDEWLDLIARITSPAQAPAGSAR